MSEGMLKAAPAVDAQPTVVEHSEPIQRALLFEGVPLDMMHHFNVTMRGMSSEAQKQMTEIYELMDGKGKQMGDLITEIRKVENKLGQPSGTETRYGRVWHYLKLSNRINDLEKQRGAFKNG